MDWPAAEALETTYAPEKQRHSNYVQTNKREAKQLAMKRGIFCVLVFVRASSSASVRVGITGESTSTDGMARDSTLPCAVHV